MRMAVKSSQAVRRVMLRVACSESERPFACTTQAGLGRDPKRLDAAPRWRLRTYSVPLGCWAAQATGGAPELVTPTLLCALLLTDCALPW
ncbi:hypothetical protein SAV14893_080920 [Streptomyces avermitilis]|uniref:Uncharacterized protein n=1 Tax=Streptomyces avermitilis TaxID=33903 RepID=A0A4D4MAM9_STRAX|nr:hypothetical protein SAV14893_080920 [Streptomyces avermitilis]GDY70924.1 hypothetical protein SAV31267_004090 [Streptomyces avermitilis]